MLWVGLFALAAAVGYLAWWLGSNAIGISTRLRITNSGIVPDRKGSNYPLSSVDPEDVLQRAKSGEALDHELYRYLPDYMASADVSQLTHQTLIHSSNEEPDVTLKKLRILGDRQWHTYRASTNSICAQLTSWISENSASASQDFIEGALVIAYCFGLKKEMYAQLLDNYRGQHRTEFEQDLERSVGNYINPWWSMEVASKEQ